jgi:hypothetical protein
MLHSNRNRFASFTTVMIVQKQNMLPGKTVFLQSITKLIQKIENDLSSIEALPRFNRTKAFLKPTSRTKAFIIDLLDSAPVNNKIGSKKKLASLHMHLQLHALRAHNSQHCSLLHRVTHIRNF